MSLATRVIVYGGYALLACVLVAYYITGVGPYDIPPAARQFKSEIERSIALGLPMTEAEVEVRVPDAANAALVVLPIAKELRRRVTVDECGLPERIPDPPSLKALIEAVRLADSDLDKVQDALAERSEWFVDNDLDLGPNIEHREFSDCKHLSRLLQRRAYLRALDGDSDGAIRDLDTIRDLGRRLATNTVAIGFIAGTGLERTSLHLAALIAFLVKDDPVALKSLAGWIESKPHEPDVRGLIRQEFFNALTIARNLDHYGGIRSVLNPMMSHSDEVFTFNPEGLQRSGPPSGMWERAFMMHAARVYNLAYAGIKDETKTRYGWSKEVSDLMDEIDRSRSLSTTFAQITVPYFLLVDRSIGRIEALRSMALATIGVHVYRIDFGALPRRLAEVGDFVDPFTGKSIGYSSSPTGFRVWSADEDLRDDGGKSRFDPPSGGRDLVVVAPPFEFKR